MEWNGIEGVGMVVCAWSYVRGMYVLGKTAGYTYIPHIPPRMLDLLEVDVHCSLIIFFIRTGKRKHDLHPNWKIPFNPLDRYSRRDYIAGSWLYTSEMYPLRYTTTLLVAFFVLVDMALAIDGVLDEVFHIISLLSLSPFLPSLSLSLSPSLPIPIPIPPRLSPSRIATPFPISRMSHLSH